MNSAFITAANHLLKREKAKIVAATGLVFQQLQEESNKHSLGKILISHRGGLWGEETPPGIGYPILRSTNMREPLVNVQNCVWCDIKPELAETSTLQTGDILITKSSGSSDLVGKASLFIQPPDNNTYLFSNFVLRLRVNQEIVLPEFVFWFLRSPQALAWRYESQQNAVGLRNLATKDFLNQVIPIPSLEIQKQLIAYFEGLDSLQRTQNTLSFPSKFQSVQSIVARIEELAHKIEEAKGLRREAVEEGEHLIPKAISSLLSKSIYPSRKLEDLLQEKTQNGLSTRPNDTPPGTPILRISAATARSDMTILEEDYKYLDVNNQIQSKYELKAGDILACRFNGNLHYVGRFAIYRNYLGISHVYPDKLIRLRVKTDIVMPEYVCLFANSPAGRSIIEAMAATTAGNIGISAGNLIKITIPIPPLPEQHRIISYLKSLQAQVDTLKSKQAESGAELNALMPSILDKAFKGEL